MEHIIMRIGAMSEHVTVEIEIPVEELIAEKRSVTRIIALYLSNAFSTSAKVWVNLQKAFDDD